MPDTPAPVKTNDPQGWIDLVWHHLEKLDLTDAERDELNTAMAWITEVVTA
jgi:hypothetical protein